MLEYGNEFDVLILLICHTSPLQRMLLYGRLDSATHFCFPRKGSWHNIIVHTRAKGLACRLLFLFFLLRLLARILRIETFLPMALAVTLVRALRLAIAAGRLASLDFRTVLLAVPLGLDASRAAGDFTNALPLTGMIRQ